MRKAKVCASPRWLDLFDAPEHDPGALHRIEVDTVATASAQDRLFAVTSPAVDVRSPYNGGEIELSAKLPEYDASDLASHRADLSDRFSKCADNGLRLRLAGKGAPGFNGGRPSDLHASLAWLQ
jgi:hypothetical protein